MSFTVASITSSAWYTSATSYANSFASSLGGYIQWAAAGTWSGMSQAASWSANTAAPAVGSAITEGISWTVYTAAPAVGSAISQGISWTVYTALPATAQGAAHGLTQLFQAAVAAPFVIARGAQTLWGSIPIQTALFILTFVGARLATDKIENNAHIQQLPVHGRILARFIAAMGIAGLAVSFGGLVGLSFTSYKLYAVALVAFAALDDKSRAFLQNAINQHEAGTWNTVPITARVRGPVAEALNTFSAERYVPSGSLAMDPVFLLEQAKRFEVRSGGWIDLSEWMTKLNPRNESQKAYALALWMHLVESCGLLEVLEETDLTVRYNHTTQPFTIRINSEQPRVPADEVAALFAQPLARARSEGDLTNA